MHDEHDDAPPPDFTPSPMIDAALTRALALLAAHQRGQIVLWAVLEAETLIDRESPSWSAFWHRLRRDFRQSTGIVLWVWKGVGVRLLTVSEQLTWRSKQRMKRAARQHFKDIVELQAIPDAEMTPHQQMERAFRVEKARERRLAILHRANVSEVLARPRGDRMPRPPA